MGNVVEGLISEYVWRLCCCMLRAGRCSHSRSTWRLCCSRFKREAKTDAQRYELAMAKDLLVMLLDPFPARRLTAPEALEHPFCRVDDDGALPCQTDFSAAIATAVARLPHNVASTLGLDSRASSSDAWQCGPVGKPGSGTGSDALPIEPQPHASRKRRRSCDARPKAGRRDGAAGSGGSGTGASGKPASLDRRRRSPRLGSSAARASARPQLVGAKLAGATGATTTRRKLRSTVSHAAAAAGVTRASDGCGADVAPAASAVPSRGDESQRAGRLSRRVRRRVVICDTDDAVPAAADQGGDGASEGESVDGDGVRSESSARSEGALTSEAETGLDGEYEPVESSSDLEGPSGVYTVATATRFAHSRPDGEPGAETAVDMAQPDAAGFDVADCEAHAAAGALEEHHRGTVARGDAAGCGLGADDDAVGAGRVGSGRVGAVANGDDGRATNKLARAARVSTDRDTAASGVLAGTPCREDTVTPAQHADSGPSARVRPLRTAGRRPASSSSAAGGLQLDGSTAPRRSKRPRRQARRLALPGTGSVSDQRASIGAPY